MMKLGENITSSSKKLFDSQPILNDKYLKAKLKKINTNFRGN